MVKTKKETIEAEGIILALGSESKTFSDMVPDGEKIITSDDALELEKPPREMVLVGAGYIGVEFATLFTALGSKVTVVEILKEILPGMETEIVRSPRRVLERNAVKIYTQC